MSDVVYLIQYSVLTWQPDTIAYQELMHLFNNGGNNTIEFNALYKEDFSRLHHKQSGIVTSNGVEFGSSFTEVRRWCNATPRSSLQPSSIPRYNLSGVSVFRSTDPSAFPLTFCKSRPPCTLYHPQPILRCMPFRNSLRCVRFLRSIGVKSASKAFSWYPVSDWVYSPLLA